MKSKKEVWEERMKKEDRMAKDDRKRKDGKQEWYEGQTCRKKKLWLSSYVVTKYRRKQKVKL